MVINSESSDREQLEISYNELTCHISWCNSYVYLGSIFTSDGKIVTALKGHARDKHKHYMKFASFMQKNPDFPFPVKHKVMSSAFLSAILYGCEGWLTNNLSEINRLYLPAIKVLLGVRQTTSNEACLLELGYPPLKYWVKDKQYKFFNAAVEQRANTNSDPLMFSIRLATRSKTPMGQFINELLQNQDYFRKGVEETQDSVSHSTRSKLIAYKSMNPSLGVHPVYTQVSRVIPDYQRLAFSRLRLISHSLRIETGRWARLPPEQRLCACGRIQSEQHVIQDCVLTQGLRTSHPNMTFTFPEFFELNRNEDICKFVHLAINTYM